MERGIIDNQMIIGEDNQIPRKWLEKKEYLDTDKIMKTSLPPGIPFNVSTK